MISCNLRPTLLGFSDGGAVRCKPRVGRRTPFATIRYTHRTFAHDCRTEYYTRLDLLYNVIMGKSRHLLLLGLSLLLTGACGGERYQLVANGKGDVYRLDTRTGEVVMIRGLGSIKVMSPAETEAATTGTQRHR